MNEGTEILGYSPLPNPKGWGCRHTITLLGFLGFSLLHGMRVTMSIAIVAMVSPAGNSTEYSDPHVNFTTTELWTDSRSSKNDDDGGLRNKDVTENVDDHIRDGYGTPSAVQFDWNEKYQGIILGAIYWGSLIAKIPGGLVAHRFGGKWPLGLGMLGIAAMTLLVPAAAVWDWRALFIVRALQGLCDALCTPAMHTILAKWAPPNERSKLGTLIYAGGQLGTAVFMVATGYLIESNVLGGWPFPFYITGALTAFWVCFWILLSSDSPDTCRRVSIKEMLYIQRSIGTVQTSKRKPRVPWKEMFTSLPVWAIIVAHASDSWGFYTFLTELPTYMKTVLKFNIKANSWLSALPYLISWGFAVTLTQIGDHFISSNKFPIVFVRKACETIGHLGSAIILVAATFVGHDRALVVTLVTVGIAINGATHGGYGVNHVDIAPNYAGVLQALTSTIASLCAIAAPYVAGSIINYNPTADGWQQVFFISAGIYLVDTVFYNLFASGEEQPWDKITD